MLVALGFHTRGSDPLPIFLHLPQMRVEPRKVHHVTNRDRFRHILVSRSASHTVLDTIHGCLKATTTAL